MKVEIFSDVACPWCFIGKRRFESALATFAHKDHVEVQWRSYQLDPGLPDHFAGTELEYLSERKGMPADHVAQMFEHVAEQASGEGLSFDFSSIVVANSFTAHRLIHLAASANEADQAKERLLSDHFEHGKDIGSREYLTELGLELGLDAESLAELFTSDNYTDAVNADIALARELGVTGVPFFVFDRKYGVSGAQSAQTFLEVLNQLWEESQPLRVPAAVVNSAENPGLNGESCGPEGC